MSTNDGNVYTEKLDYNDSLILGLFFGIIGMCIIAFVGFRLKKSFNETQKDSERNYFLMDGMYDET